MGAADVATRRGGTRGQRRPPRYPTRGSATPAVRSAGVHMSGTARPTVSDRHGHADETPSGGSVKRQRNRARPAPARGTPYPQVYGTCLALYG